MPRRSLRFEKVHAFCSTDGLRSKYYAHYRSLGLVAKKRLVHLDHILDQSRPPSHCVLSPPALVQGDMDAQLSKVASFIGLDPRCDWTMLAQWETVEDTDWQWGDAGVLYFWVPTEDLANNHFDRTWAIGEGC